MLFESGGRDAAFSSRSTVLAAAIVAAFALVFRFLTFRDLSNDHYMHLGWAQQLLFGELPGRDFVDPGLPLQYAVSAFVQWLWPGPFSEGMASIAFLALAAGAVALVTGLAMRSTVAAVVAGLVTIAWLPRYYSYPKVLVPAITLYLVYRYARRPAIGGAAVLAAWTVIATLLRHDLGVFAALAVACALVTAHRVPPRDRFLHMAVYGAIAAVASLPYLAFVQWSEGLGEHLRIGNEFAKTDLHQLFIAPGDWPTFAGLPPSAWLIAQPDTVVFWLTHALIVAMAALALREARRNTERAPFIVAALVFLICYRLTILRHSLPARLPDLAALYAVCSVVVVVETARFVRAGMAARPVLAAGAAAVALVCGVPGVLALERTVNLRGEIRQAGLVQGPREIASQAVKVLGRARSGSWDEYWPAGDIPPVIAYLSTCTGDRDRLLTTWPAAEYYFFARRPFGGPHLAFFHRDAFSSGHDQARALARLKQQYVPVVLINQSRREFVEGFPMIADYITSRYQPIGHFTISDGSDVAIGVRRDLKPRRTFGDERWPCDFERPSPASARTE
jgi:hypothetical protein